MKHPKKSKTLIINGVAMATLVVGELIAQAGLIQATVSPKVYLVVALVLGLTNVVLRFVTKEKIGFESTGS